jgi:hypothetical protein
MGACPRFPRFPGFGLSDGMGNRSGTTGSPRSTLLLFLLTLFRRRFLLSAFSTGHVDHLPCFATASLLPRRYNRYYTTFRAAAIQNCHGTKARYDGVTAICKRQDPVLPQRRTISLRKRVPSWPRRVYGNGEQADTSPLVSRYGLLRRSSPPRRAGLVSVPIFFGSLPMGAIRPLSSRKDALWQELQLPFQLAFWVGYGL